MATRKTAAVAVATKREPRATERRLTKAFDASGRRFTAVIEEKVGISAAGA